MALPRHRPERLERGLERRLHLCVECGSGLVHPVDWEEAGRDHWTVSLRCPNCEWMGSGTFSQSVVDAFDRELDQGAQAVMRDLGELARANMTEDVARFTGALRAGAILPEDF